MVVSFTLENCEGCKKVIPKFQQRAMNVKKDFEILKVDLHKFDDIAKKYKVEFAPHAFLFQNGKKLSEFKGVVSDEELDTFFVPLMK